MSARSYAVVALGLLALACSPEKRAQKVFDRYENVFAECKRITEEAGAEPGTHYCSKLAGKALDSSLDGTGIDKGTRNAMINEWVSSNPLGEFYADEHARREIPDM